MRRRVLATAACLMAVLVGATDLAHLEQGGPAVETSPEAYRERQRALIERYLRDPRWQAAYDADLGVLPPGGTIPSFRNTAYLVVMMLLELQELVRELGYDPLLEVSKMIERMITSQGTTSDGDITAYPNIISGLPSLLASCYHSSDRNDREGNPFRKRI